MVWILDDNGLLIVSTEKQRSEFPSQSLNPKGRKQEVVGIRYNSNDLLPWENSGTKMPLHVPLWAQCHHVTNKHLADMKGYTVKVALFPCNECIECHPGQYKRSYFMSDKYHDSDKTTAFMALYLTWLGSHSGNLHWSTTRVLLTFQLTADGASNFCEPHLIKSLANWDYSLLRKLLMPFFLTHMTF